MKEHRITAEEAWARQKERLAAMEDRRRQKHAEKVSTSPGKSKSKGSWKASGKASCRLALVAVNGLRVGSGQDADKMRTSAHRASTVLAPYPRDEGYQLSLFGTVSPVLSKARDCSRVARPKCLHGGCLLYRLPVRPRTMD